MTVIQITNEPVAGLFKIEVPYFTISDNDNAKN